MTLTARQRDALELSAAGRTPEQIAPKLGVTPRQVKRYLEEARHRYDAPTSAVAWIRYRNSVIRRQPRDPATGRWTRDTPSGPGLWEPLG